MFDKYTDCIKLGKKIRFEVDIRMLQRDRWIKSMGKNMTWENGNLPIFAGKIKRAILRK